MTAMRKGDVRTETDIERYLSEWSEFEKAVYITTFRIPHGKVSTYGQVAKMVGKPKACRAVANALHNNPLFPVVPCWRVVKSDGGFGGEKSAATARRNRVKSEGVPIKDDKVVMRDDLIFRGRV